MGRVRSSCKTLGNHVDSAEEEQERLQWEGFAEKEGFKLGVGMSNRPVKRSDAVLPCWCGCLATIELFLSAQRDDMCMHGFVGGCKSGDQPDPAWCLGRPASDCYNAEFADTCCQTCDEYKVRNASQPGMIYNYILGWWRGTVVERLSLAGELSLSCA